MRRWLLAQLAARYALAIGAVDVLAAQGLPTAATVLASLVAVAGWEAVAYAREVAS